MGEVRSPSQWTGRVQEVLPERWEGSGAHQAGWEGLGWLEEVKNPARRAGKGWKVLQESREWSQGPGKVKSFSWCAWRIWVALLEGWEG